MIINNNILLQLILVASISLATACKTASVSSKTSKNNLPKTNQNDSTKTNEEFYVKETIRYDDYVYNKNIRSILLHKRNVELGEPYIVLNSSEQLILRFDELDAEFNSYQYQFIHCDHKWEKSNLSELDYISGFNENYFENSLKSFNTHQQYVHYWTTFPNEDVEFLISGNYIVKVFEENNPDQPIFCKKFYVTEQNIFPEINISYPSDVEQRYYQQEVDFNFKYSSNQIIDPYSNINVIVEQNHREDNCISSIEPNFIRENTLVYNYDKENIFDGGNEFRYINLTSFLTEIDRIERSELSDSSFNIILTPDEKRTYKRYLEKPDINGKFLIKTIDGEDQNLEGDYANVKFTLPYRSTLDQGDLYIFGQLTNWKIDPIYQMKFNSTTACYENELYLKQGYYNYIYLYVNDTTKSADIRHIEGSHFDTENDYIFKVYYSDPGDFFDRLLLYHVENSRKSF